MAPSPTQAIGYLSEHFAARWLEHRGVHILERNLLCRAGEIDLVAREDQTLVFVEVRHRNSSSHGGAAASVNRSKQRRLLRAAHFHLPGLISRHFGGRMPPCRFDVICVESGHIHWIRHAFTE